MVDHTFCYTAPVLKMRELIEEGHLGDILFVDSVRINLGIVQPDVDVFWDLAPHDLSILDFILPGGLVPTGVAAQGADPLGTGQTCVGYLTLPLPGGAIAHVHVNWLSPTKIRQMVIGGSKRTLVWDDLSPQQRAHGLRPRRRARAAAARQDDGATSPTGSATPGRPRSRRRRRSASWSRSSRRPSARAARRAPTATPACASWTSSSPPRSALPTEVA